MVIRNYLRGLPKLLYITKMVAKDDTQTEAVSTICFTFFFEKGVGGWSAHEVGTPCFQKLWENFVQSKYRDLYLAR